MGAESMSNESAEVIVYSRALCPYCARLKELLKKKRIVFRDLKNSELKP